MSFKPSLAGYEINLHALRTIPSTLGRVREPEMSNSSTSHIQAHYHWLK